MLNIYSAEFDGTIPGMGGRQLNVALIFNLSSFSCHLVHICEDQEKN